MKEYTAKYDTAAIKGVCYSYRAENDAAAIEFAKEKFTVWPNVTIYDDTDSEKAAEGRVAYRMMQPIERNDYKVVASISGHWRLERNDELVYEDSACNDLNGTKEEAEDFYNAVLEEEYKEYEKEYRGFRISIKEDMTFYYIDFHTGLGEALYRKKDWSLEDALADQVTENEE